MEQQMMEKSGNKALLMVRIVAIAYFLMGLSNLIQSFFDWEFILFGVIYIAEIFFAAMLLRLKNAWRIIVLIDSIAFGLVLNCVGLLGFYLLPEVREDLMPWQHWVMTYEIPVHIVLNAVGTAVLLSKPVKKLFTAAE